MKRALISVSDKTGLCEFAAGLIDMGYEIISTGGTLESLKTAGIAALNVEDVTGFKECLDGRVKTLHPAVHGGILAVRENESHMEALTAMGIGLIDIVAVNLYPFKNTILKDGVTTDQAIENIDIGGPSMVRSAAKNYKYVTVITEPGDYAPVIDELKTTGQISFGTRLSLSAKAFAHTAAYDTIIANYMAKTAGLEGFPPTFTVTYEKISDMRYGENPHQKAAYYREIKPEPGCVTEAKKLHGKELSFNNINDLNGAVALVKEFDRPACVCVKHSTPCGVGEGENIYSAYMKAYEADPVSVYGGIVALNREVDGKTAAKMNEIFLEIVIAPSYTEEAFNILSKKKNIRIMSEPSVSCPVNGLDMKKVSGGLLVQESDGILIEAENLKCVTEKEPTEEEMRDLLFAFKVVKHTKSNAIVACKNGQTLGVSGGQVRRIWAMEEALSHGSEILGAHTLKGAVIASDAFFTYDDCVEAAHKAGISAIIQPGGSVRDGDSIKKCNEYGIAMIFTGLRHFRH